MAALPVATYITSLCPLLAASPAQDVYVELATDMTSVAYYGPRFANYAIALRAMHMFTVDRERPLGEAGLVTAKTEGRVSIHFWNQVPEHSSSDLHMSQYGKRLWALMNAMKPGVTIANGRGRSPDLGIIPEAD